MGRSRFSGRARSRNKTVVMYRTAFPPSAPGEITTIVGEPVTTGTTGSTGPAGPVGPIGPVGPQGSPGVEGTQGVQGPVGPQGLPGQDGIMGATGLKGDTGNTGSQGAPGIKGDTGNTGLTGNTGSQGIQGIQGPVGLTGNTGATGPASTVAGPQGIQGVKGDTGLQGIQGIPGNTGTAGTTDFNGITNKPTAFSPGYVAGAGGVVTQATSRVTGVTLSKLSGAITLFSKTTTAGLVESFTVTNTLIAATDTIVLSVRGTGIFFAYVTQVAAGSFRISIHTPAATTIEAPTINFAVVKAVSV